MSKQTSAKLKDDLRSLVDGAVRSGRGPDVQKFRARLDEYLETLVKEAERK